MELLEVVKYSILLPSQNIPQRLAKGIASFLEIFNSPDCTLKKKKLCLVHSLFLSIEGSKCRKDAITLDPQSSP